VESYQYANNNPIKYNDPSGHCIEIEEGLCAHLGEKKNTYHISAPFRNRFNGDFEADAGAFIITGDPETLRYSAYGAGFMAGAAIENACNGLGIDCGNYYNTVFTALTAMTGAFGGAYPSPGIGPGSAPNVAMPSSVRSDLGDPDCPGCGYQQNVTFPPNNSQTEHIFRDKTGHLTEDTPTNRALVVNTVQTQNYQRTDKFGNDWYARLLNNGTEVWVKVRNGVIQDAGLNQTPRWIK
jgi:hypothetical protein